MSKKGRADKSRKPGNKAALPARKKKPVEAAPPAEPVRVSEPPAPVSARTPSMRPSAPPISMKEDPAPEPTEAEREEREENDFFERPSREDLASLAHGDDDAHEPPLPPKMAPHAIARRAQYRKYVNAVMAICGGVLALGVVSTAVRRAGGDESTASAGVPQSAPVKPTPVEPPATAAAVLPSPPPPPENKEKMLEAVPPPPPEKPAEPEPAPAAEKAPEKAAEVVPEKSGKTALEEKRDAQRLLERAKWQDSIAAAERSVALDPSDGEAWLLLGAAYQSAGKPMDARRAFTSCLKEGKKGPISECRAMLR
jgi:hypothetical protein